MQTLDQGLDAIHNGLVIINFQHSNSYMNGADEFPGSGLAKIMCRKDSKEPQYISSFAFSYEYIMKWSCSGNTFKLKKEGKKGGNVY